MACLAHIPGLVRVTLCFYKPEVLYLLSARAKFWKQAPKGELSELRVLSE